MSDEQNIDTEVKPSAKKTRAPRKSVRKVEAPSDGEAGAPAAPAEKPAKKPRAPRQQKKDTLPKEPQAKKEAGSSEAPKAPKPRKTAQPRPEQSGAAPQQPINAKPLNTSEERADNTSEEKPLVRHLEQQPPKPVSVPGFATPETVGGETSNGGNSRRKRRRNRNRNRGDEQTRPQDNTLTRVDNDELNRRAWKIFLAEVSEEGLALMDDATTREASRRAFRVAELFLLEAARHRPNTDTPVPNEDSETNEAPEAPESPEEAEETAGA